MKNFILIGLMLILTICYGYSQNIDIKNISIQELKKNATKTDFSVIPMFLDNKSTKGKLYDLLKLNLYKYFGINEKYDSPLKRKVFENTEVYDSLLNVLKDKKESLLKNTLFYNDSYLESIFEITNPMYNEFGGEKYVVNYNLENKGFHISMDYKSNVNCIEMSNTIQDFDFSILPTYRAWNKYKTTYDEMFIFKVDETNALEIEENRKNIGIIFIFKISDIKIKTINENKGEYGCQHTFEVIPIKQLRLVIYNKVNNKIYYDKLF
jgi:hypothetical protein